MANFVDRVVLHVAAGDGGHGVASVKREKFKPLGGPDGGNGGDGGDVILRVDPQSTTLLDYHHSPHRKAGSGKPGQGSHRSGAEGGDIELAVPLGTVVKDAYGEVLADLVTVGERFVVARGGRGGLGNAALASIRLAVISAKLNIFGPTMTGTDNAAGSSTLWPPIGTRLPPTKATSPAA